MNVSSGEPVSGSSNQVSVCPASQADDSQASDSSAKVNTASADNNTSLSSMETDVDPYADYPDPPPGPAPPHFRFDRSNKV